jgi:hypothetical protein
MTDIRTIRHIVVLRQQLIEPRQALLGKSYYMNTQSVRTPWLTAASPGLHKKEYFISVIIIMIANAPLNQS